MSGQLCTLAMLSKSSILSTVSFFLFWFHGWYIYYKTNVLLKRYHLQSFWNYFTVLAGLTRGGLTLLLCRQIIEEEIRQKWLSEVFDSCGLNRVVTLAPFPPQQQDSSAQLGLDSNHFSFNLSSSRCTASSSLCLFMSRNTVWGIDHKNRKQIKGTFWWWDVQASLCFPPQLYFSSLNFNFS